MRNGVICRLFLVVLFVFLCFFFFFQAEDGIRDPLVTGVQTCALPILLSNFAAVYEAIVMGANRIDVVRRANIVCTVSEAIAIIVAMHLGRGLFAMSRSEERRVGKECRCRWSPCG